MPTAAQLQQLTISINGRIDPSVISMINAAESQLKRLNASTKTVNAAMSGVYKDAFGGMEKAAQHVSKIQDVLSKIAPLAGGVSIGTLLAQGMSEAVEKAEQFAGFIGDAVQKAGMFTRTTEQLGIELGRGPNDPYTKGIMDKMQEYSFQTHLIPDVLIEAFRSTKSSGFTDEETFKHIQEIANISAATVPHGENASQAFLELMEVYNKAAKGGATLEKTLYGFEKRGVAIRGLLARFAGLDVPSDIVNLDPDDPRAQAIDTELAKRLKARKVPFAPVGESISQLGGTGGKYGAAGLQQSKDLLGAESIIQGWGEMLTRELGHAFEGPLVALLNKVNDTFNWSKFKATQDFLDSFAVKTTKAFEPVIDRLGKINWDEVGANMVKVIDASGKIFEKSMPFITWLATDLPQELETLLKLAHAFERITIAIEKMFLFVDKTVNPRAPSGAVQEAMKNLVHRIINR